MSKQRILLWIFGAWFVIILLKLFYLQVFPPLSASSYLRYSKIYPERGKIMDRNSQPLAINQTKYLLYLEPQKVDDFDLVFELIDKELKIGIATLEANVDRDKEWVAVRGAVEEDTKNRLEKRKVEGLGFDPQLQRYYPEASLAAHLLGFVGKNEEGENIGYFGIEGFYDKDLFGLPGILKTERDLMGNPILVGTQDKTAPEDGRNLVLTIDKSVQALAKRELQAGIERHSAREGCVIIADPATMEILALSCLPDFDPDKYYEFTEEFFKNPAITSTYEPGSTFKPLIIAASIEEKKIKPTDFYNESGSVEIGGYSIKTWDNKYEGKITMTRILEKSSNVGMVHVGSKLGEKKLYEYMQKFGFGRATGIDLQGEATSYLRPRDEWYPIDYATATFGQGIAVTPIQMVRAFASVINGGKLLRPHVVKQVVAGDDIKTIEPEVEARVISERTSAIIRKMLVSTVKHGEYKYQIPEGYQIGGKTGTAQIAIEGHYDPSKTIASFIGFAPADDPKFVALVILAEPKTSPYGSETAAPLFFDIARELLLYYNIAPSE